MCIVQVTVFALWTNDENVVWTLALKQPKNIQILYNWIFTLFNTFKQIFGEIHFIFRQSELLLKWAWESQYWPARKGSQSSHHPVTIETKLGKEHQNQKKEEVKIYGDAQVKLSHSWFVVSLFMWFVRKIKWPLMKHMLKFMFQGASFNFPIINFQQCNSSN